MKNPKEELVRIKTQDGLELHGILFEPKKRSINALVHVHGWIGNFYENLFIDYVAKEAVSKGVAFLTFNNRGMGIVTDLIRRKKSKVEYVRIGGCLERFEDCVIDIRAAIDFLSKKGYKKIILQGHSLGCQKIAFYKYKTRDKKVVGLILLAPVDDVGYTRRLLGRKYKKSLEIAGKMIRKGKGDEPVPDWMRFYPLLSAKRYLDVADPKNLQGRIFNYSGKLMEIKNIDFPVLAVFGSKDDYESKPEEKLRILKSKMKKGDITLIQGANHLFVNHETKLGKIISTWLKSTFL